MGFSPSFLQRLYAKLDKNKITETCESFGESAIPLPENPYLKSLYVSIVPYLESQAKPTHQIIEIKLTEAIYCLLQLDTGFYNCFFGQYLSESFLKATSGLTKNRQWNHANMTNAYESCYNLIVFPRRWIICERMETDYMINKAQNVSTVIYMGVRYKSVVRYRNSPEKHFN